MAREGVGDALRRVHGWLRPGGTLVNVQPEPAPKSLRACRRARKRPLGLAHDATSFHENLRLTDLELDRAVAAGMFARMNEEQFEIDSRFETLDDWRDFLIRPYAGALEIDPVKIARAEAALGRSELTIIATEAEVAAAFRKIP